MSLLSVFKLPYCMFSDQYPTSASMPQTRLIWRVPLPHQIVPQMVDPSGYKHP